MAWPPLDQTTHLWLTRSVAVPALRVTAGDVQEAPGGRILADGLRAAADSLTAASTSVDATQRARDAGIALLGLSGALTPWGKQLYRATVRLLGAVARGPGDTDHAEEDHQAWRWAARTTQRCEATNSEVDRIAVMLVAGATIDSGVAAGVHAG